MLDHSKLLKVLEAHRIVISDVTPCSECGSELVDKHTKECVGCEIQRETGLSFNEVCEAAWSSYSYEGVRYVNLRNYHHDKRRGNRQQEVAERAQIQFFYGEVCEDCGTNLKRTNSRNCVACGNLNMRHRFDRGDKVLLCVGRSRPLVKGRWFPVLTMQSDRIIRQTAAEIGEVTYHGYPCDCGSTERYTKRGQCVGCVKARNRKRKPASARTEAGVSHGEFDFLFS